MAHYQIARSREATFYLPTYQKIHYFENGTNLTSRSMTLSQLVSADSIIFLQKRSFAPFLKIPFHSHLEPFNSLSDVIAAFARSFCQRIWGRSSIILHVQLGDVKGSLTKTPNQSKSSSSNNPVN